MVDDGAQGKPARRNARAPAVELPPADTRRCVVRRKAVVVAAVRSGVITLEEACQHYSLSTEEFLSWQRALDSHGFRALRVTRLQDYRGRAPTQLRR
ncbi:MAG: DUF1153 domain-containing protein [Alphaproteobacteria bacterium]|nr:DUF1153 domain-containing protein [Alphaproteobacteria bacterium]